MRRLQKISSTLCGHAGGTAGRMGLLWVSVSRGAGRCLRRPAPLPSSCWHTDFQGPSLHSSEKGVGARPPCSPVAILLVTPTSLTSSPHPHGGQGLSNVPLGSGMLRGRAAWSLTLSTTFRLDGILRPAPPLPSPLAPSLPWAAGLTPP